MWVRSLAWKDLLEKDMATLFSVLAWRIPRTEEPGGLQSMRSQKSQIGLKRLNTQDGMAPLEIVVVVVLPFS